MDSCSTNIKLTPGAISAAARIKLENADYKDLVLRLYIDGKGCDGFSYGVTFSSKEPGDLAIPCADLEVIIDRESLRFMDGSTVDWVDDERGRGFLVDNPLHRHFRGKFFKRQSWKEKLTSAQATSE